jgi:uncharacterized protein (AIM24 family)
MDNGMNNGSINIAKNNGNQPRRPQTMTDNMNNGAQNSQQGQQMWTGNMAPGSVVGTRDNIKIIENADFSKYGLRVEIMEYQKLLGCTNIHSAQSLWFMKEANIKCRQIAIYILNSSVKIEAGAMSYFQGPLQMTTGITNAGKLLTQTLTGKLTGERIAMPEYSGSGILVLEPSFKHFLTLELEPNEYIICDKGMFFAASTSVNVQPCLAGNASGTLLGGEGIFQQMITGPGMVILESPVPECEINKITLRNDVLRVDGNFALLRTGGIEMSVERSSKTLVGSAVSGEGLVNVYRGTGQVWIAPTIKAYEGIRNSYAHGGDIGQVDFNTSTGHTK